MTFTMGVKFALKLTEMVIHFAVVVGFAPEVMGLNLIVRYLAYFHTFLYNQFIRPVALRRAESSDAALWLVNAKNLVRSPDRHRPVHHPRLHGPVHARLPLPLRRRARLRALRPLPLSGALPGRLIRSSWPTP